MSTGRIIEQKHGIFFITFSCYSWLPLFEQTKSYDLVYNWFDVLISNGHQITGYVIMPNHIHVLIAIKTSGQTINTIVSNGKRFMAYGIIKRLNFLNLHEVIFTLSSGVTEREKSKGQVHRVFEHGFDVKICETEKFIEQKLNYIHHNPCSKKWNLAENPIDYKHSCMKFYTEYDSEINSKLVPYTALFEK